MTNRKPIWVYVAGPYTGGDPVVNVRRAVEIGIALRREGLVPIIPHLSHLAHLVSPQPYEFWMGLDFAMIERCDAMVRLEGASSGADREVELAGRLGLPVIEVPSEWEPAMAGVFVGSKVPR